MIPFNIPPYVKESSDYIAQAIANRKICGDGPFTKRCNQQLEEMTGACKALLTTSGTSAMELAALLLDDIPHHGLIYDCDRFWHHLPVTLESNLAYQADLILTASQGLEERQSL